MSEENSSKKLKVMKIEKSKTKNLVKSTSELRLTYPQLILPFWCSKKSKNKNRFNLGKNIVNEALDIKSYILKINQMDII
jgi:hypothetical protein